MHEADRELAARLSRGQDAAFRDFCDDYFPKLYRFCLKRVSKEDAEEVTQNVLMNAINSIGSYRGEASLYTWLCQIARNEISAVYRRERRQRTLFVASDLSEEEIAERRDGQAEDPQQAPEQLATSAEHERLIHGLLDQLPGDYGRVLEWKYVLGLSVEEIAERLGTTPTAVQSALARARDAFRRAYQTLGANTLAMPHIRDREGSDERS